MRGDERPREKKKKQGGRGVGGGVRGSKSNRTGREQEAKKSKCTQNERMIRFMRRKATKFVSVLKNPSLLHLMGTRHGL